MQVQDFALAWEEVVLDVEAVHGLEMAAQDGGGDEFGDGGGFVVAEFQIVKNFRPACAVFLGGLVPLRDAGIEVPAVVVEAWGMRERFDFGAGFLFDVKETNDHVGDLHAGVSSAATEAATVARFTRMLMYPAPATSIFSIPGSALRPSAISSAIFLGALRSFLASSKASVSAYSPSSTFGGCSMETLATSRSYFWRRNSRTWAARLRCRLRYKKLL